MWASSEDTEDVTNSRRLAGCPQNDKYANLDIAVTLLLYVRMLIKERDAETFPADRFFFEMLRYIFIIYLPNIFVHAKCYDVNIFIS